MSTSLPPLRAGIYRHYKGHLYLVIGYANDANQEGRTVVVYIGLDLNGARHGERLSVRTVDDFFGLVNYLGVVIGVPRFAYVGPVVPDEEMPR